MQGLIRSFLMGIRRGQGQVPPDKIDGAPPIPAAKPHDQQILKLLDDSWQESRSSLYTRDDETRMHDSPTGGPANGVVWRGYTSRRPFGSAAESVQTPNRVTPRVQKTEYVEKMITTAHALRNLGRKYLIRSRQDDDGESNFYKLGRQAWHVGTAMLIVNQDLKARMHLCESTRALSERLTTILQQLHPNAKQDELLQCDSIPKDTCDETKEKEEKTDQEAKEIKRKQKIRRKRKQKPKPATPPIFSDPALPGQG